MDFSSSPPIIGMPNAPTCVEMINIIDPPVEFQNLFGCCCCGSQEAYNILPQCLHSFCNTCKDNVATGNSFRCKTCNELSNSVIYNSVLCKMNSHNKTPACAWCSEGNEINASSGHCEQCKQWLCSECIKGHNRMPSFKSHTFTMFSEDTDTSLKCETHPRESLELFCETCGVLTCRNCQLSVHRDHIGHQWVNEKATALKPSLFSTVTLLEDKIQLLLKSSSLTLVASKVNGCLQESVRQAKFDLHQRAKAITEAVKVHAKIVEEQINKKADEHVQRLTKADTQMRKLQERIEFLLKITRKLIENADRDPASLVQLADAIQTRHTCLSSQADILVSDLAIDNKTTALSDIQTVTELKAAHGWLLSAASRVVHLSNRDPNELARLSAIACWTHNNVDLPLPTNLHNGTQEAIINHQKSGSGGESDSDSVDTEEELFNNTVATVKHETPIRNESNTNDWTSGCAVCLGSGMLGFCVQCYRCFHPDCHLPRASPDECFQYLDKRTSDSGVAGWRCSLCNQVNSQTLMSKKETIVKSTRRVRDFKWKLPSTTTDTCLTWEEFQSACCILLSLFIHPEAVYYTSSICPVCCAPILYTDPLTQLEASECLDGKIFHRMPNLRFLLETSAPLLSKDETESSKPIQKRIDIISWILQIDLFFEEVINTKNKVTGVTSTLVNSATQLRDKLDQFVEDFWPSFFD